jgi:hypothetical protein
LDSRTEKQAAERGGSYLLVEESQFFCGHIISLRRVRHCRPSASYFILNNLGFDAVGTYFSNTLFRLSKSILTGRRGVRQCDRIRIGDIMISFYHRPSRPHSFRNRDTSSSQISRMNRVGSTLCFAWKMREFR